MTTKATDKAFIAVTIVTSFALYFLGFGREVMWAQGIVTGIWIGRLIDKR